MTMQGGQAPGLEGAGAYQQTQGVEAGQELTWR